MTSRLKPLPSPCVRIGGQARSRAARSDASDQVPDDAAEARRWIMPWLNMLKTQALGEDAAVDVALNNVKPLLSSEVRRIIVSG